MSTGTRRGGTAHVHAAPNVAMAAPEAPCSPAPRSPPPARARCHSVQSAAPTANSQRPSAPYNTWKLPWSNVPRGHLCSISQRQIPSYQRQRQRDASMSPVARVRVSRFWAFFSIVSARLNTASSQPWSLLYPFPTLEPTSVQSTSHSFFFFFLRLSSNPFLFDTPLSGRPRIIKKQKQKQKRNPTLLFAHCVLLAISNLGL